uniref:Phosphoglucomutase-2 n=1 Tax=Cacopsylla melanoneura TaxID=428564 RepID=A0A8D8M0H6_9HEMI
MSRMGDKQDQLTNLLPFPSSDIKIPSDSNSLFHLVFERFPGHVWTQLFKNWGLGVTSAFFNFMYWNKNEDVVRDMMSKDDAFFENREAMSDLFLKRLKFGTAGIRGPMGVGFSQMNDVVIIQTGQGILRCAEKHIPDFKESGVIVGYDGRHNSKRFAELTASVFHHGGVKRVYLVSRVCPTPIIAYSIRTLNLALGIMITASHNPKQDNGYKLYDSKGCQIISPIDKQIQEEIMRNLEIEDHIWDIKDIRDHLQPCPLDSVLVKYGEAVLGGAYNLSLNEKSQKVITYSAMHGVGTPFVTSLFKQFKFKPLILVEAQCTPDPEFSTVLFPNPEEPSSLDLALKTADQHGSTLVIANDPDADRLAVAEKSKDGHWKIFNGNELGALFGWWALHRLKTKHPDANMKDYYFLASTVSSKILNTIAKAEGLNHDETLTGFKWMGNRIHELELQGKHSLLAFEEAIGFMDGTHVLDKDGVTAAVRLAELVAYLETQDKDLHQLLGDIYDKYGHHITHNSYYICHNQITIENIFHRLRHFNSEPDSYPPSLLNGKYKVTHVRDLTTGYDSGTPDHKATLPSSKSSEMITFTFDNGLVATLRTSGTEPKIKYYTELVAKPELKDREELSKTLDEMVNAIVSEYLQPEHNGLTPRPN